MKLIFILIVFYQVSHAQIMEVRWNNQFRKEISVTCSAEETFCESLCQSASACIIPEGFCRDCIGTTLKMNYLFSELGNTILNTGSRANKDLLLEMMLKKEFISLTSQDVYNVIDPAQSIRAIKKFEKLCPDESVAQILFMRVDPISRELKNPEYVYCDLFDHTEIYKMTMRPGIEIQAKKNR